MARVRNIDSAELPPELAEIYERFAGSYGPFRNQVAVFASEFDAVQREYPILFARTADGSLQGVAILGLARDENLFLDSERWDAAYVPALLRRAQPIA